MTEATQIQAQLEVKGCTAELYLNDIPMMRLTPDSMGVQLLAAEQLVIPGKNRLEVLVEPGPTPSLARAASRSLEEGALGEAPRAVAKLLRFKLGEEPSLAEPETLCEALWQWPLTPPGEPKAPVLFPQSVVAEVDMGKERPRWRWQDSPPLVLERSLREETMAFLDEMEAAFRDRRLDVLWDLSLQQNEDVQRCYPGLTEAFLKADLARIVDFYHRSPDPVLPRDPRRTDFRLVADGRLLQPVDTDWSYTFKLLDPDDGSKVGVPMYLALVGPRLRIVR